VCEKPQELDILVLPSVFFYFLVIKLSVSFLLFIKKEKKKKSKNKKRIANKITSVPYRTSHRLCVWAMNKRTQNQHIAASRVGWVGWVGLTCLVS